MTISAHPLADLFPLIEGVEFDDLVESIRAHGLHDAITLFDGLILDGRNRYRACSVANVEPRFEDYTGDDPCAFVVDKNIHRRHLDTTQRAMIAGRMANLDQGGDRRSEKFKTEISDLKITANKAASLFNVSADMVGFAKTVIREGTAEEIAAVEKGEAAVSTIAKQIRQRIPAEVRTLKKEESEGTIARTAKAKMRAQMWGHLRDALTHFTDLPRPADVVPIARSHDRGGLVDAKLFSSIQWLKDFAHEWSKRDGVSDQDGSVDGDDHADTRTRDRAS